MPAIEELLDADSLYIVSAVLRTKSLELVTEVGELLSADGSVPDLGAGISGKIKISTQGKDKKRILLSADEPVVFAFQAVRTLYDNGRYETIRPDRRMLIQHSSIWPNSLISSIVIECTNRLKCEYDGLIRAQQYAFLVFPLGTNLDFAGDTGT